MDVDDDGSDESDPDNLTLLLPLRKRKIQRRAQVRPADPPESIRDDWRFASFLSFLRVFKNAGIIRQVPVTFTTEDLVKELADMGSPAHKGVVGLLIWYMLSEKRGKELREAIEEEPEGWQELLQDQISAEWQNFFKCDPLKVGSFLVQPPATKLRILEVVCILVASSPRCRDFMEKKKDPSSFRLTPLGEDAEGHKYFIISEVG